MVCFIIYCVLTGAFMIYATYFAITVDTRYVAYMIITAVAFAAPFAQVLVFFLMMRAMCLSYDDWTHKMLVATATPLDHSPEVRNHSPWL